MKKYYKVVSDGLKSAMASSLDAVAVQYKLGEWVYPSLEGSRLFVFDNLENATAFYRGNYETVEIYECVVKHPSRVKQLSLVMTKYILKFWKFKLNHKRVDNLLLKGTVPRGTVGCQAVKLLKKVVNP